MNREAVGVPGRIDEAVGIGGNLYKKNTGGGGGGLVAVPVFINPRLIFRRRKRRQIVVAPLIAQPRRAQLLLSR